MQGGRMLTVLCVLRSGGDYTPEYVRILRDSVRRHWPDGERFRFACITDLPRDRFDSDIETFGLVPSSLPGWWAKMYLFSPTIEAKYGGRLYFDLDTAITGPLDDVVARCKRAEFTILRDFYRPQGYGSGVMFIPRGFGFHVWENFEKDSHRIIGAMRGDQDYLETAIVGAARWQDVCPNRFVSFKPVPIAGAKLNSLPKGASVVCFHGLPRPADLPQDNWIRQHWRRESMDEVMLGKTGTWDAV